MLRLSQLIIEAAPSQNLGRDLLDSIECLHSVRPDDASEIGRSLRARAHDTPSRYRAYLSAQSVVSGQSFVTRPPDAGASACEF